MTQTQEPSTDNAVDLDAIRARYRLERDKRLRPEGDKQYLFTDAGEFSDFGTDPWVGDPEPRESVHDEVDVTVLGTGFGGMVAGSFMRKAGLDKVRFVDAAGDFGGTWYWNRYPGLACDVESYIYLPLIEEVGTMPSRKYAPGEEIRQHAISLANHFDLYRDVLFQTEVTAFSWNDETERWTITTNRGDEFSSRYVVVSSGPLQRPKVPILPGVRDFRGHMFHTSRWDYDYTGGDYTGGMDKLADKRVALIGTGATGLQITPHLARDAKELFVVQRTPSTVDVRGDEETDKDWWDSLEPGWQLRRRENFIDIVHSTGAEENMVGSGWTDIGPVRGMNRLVASGFSEDPGAAFELADAEKMSELRDRVAQIVDDPTTAASLQPWYQHMCKRPGFSDLYLQAFNQDNVTLVDSDGQGIERFTEKGFVVQGVEYEVDAIIFATGYENNLDPASRAGVSIHGRKGLALNDYWADGLRTLHGWVSRGFPNLLHMGVLQNAHAVNFTHILEEQAAHLAAVVAEAERRGDVLIEPTEEAEANWVARIRAEAGSEYEFLAACTPGYYNGEGQPREKYEFFAGGPVAFRGLMKEWRETGGYDDVMTATS